MLIGNLGKNRTRAYDDKQGTKRYVAEVVGDQIVLLDKKVVSLRFKKLNIVSYGSINNQ